MKYRLKDRDLQRKLDEISNGNFSKMTEKFFDGRTFPITVYFHYVPEGKGGYFKFSATFQADEVEEVREYDPNRWNLYPEVTPPQGTMMRIKYHDVTSEDRKIERGFAIFDCGQWVNDSGYPKFPNNPQNYVVWFRPWIGPDEEGEE